MSDFSKIADNKAIILNFSSIIDKLNCIRRAEFETLSIVLNNDQLEMLLQSLKEAKDGNVVTVREAFSDLISES